MKSFKCFMLCKHSNVLKFILLKISIIFTYSCKYTISLINLCYCNYNICHVM